MPMTTDLSSKAQDSNFLFGAPCGEEHMCSNRGPLGFKRWNLRTGGPQCQDRCTLRWIAPLRLRHGWACGECDDLRACPETCNHQTFMTRDELLLAVDEYLRGPTATLVDTYGDIKEWCVGQIDDFSELFATSRNPLAASFDADLHCWDMSSAKAISRMFSGAEMFHGDLSEWNTENVEDMQELFLNAHSFNGDISNWNTASVTTMNSAFAFAKSFDKPIGSWEVSMVRDMRAMFFGAHTFDQDISNWNVSAVDDMVAMFWGAQNFTQNLCPWGDIMTVTTPDKVASMFELSGCQNTNDPLLTYEKINPLCHVCL